MVPDYLTIADAKALPQKSRDRIIEGTASVKNSASLEDLPSLDFGVPGELPYKPRLADARIADQLDELPCSIGCTCQALS